MEDIKSELANLFLNFRTDLSENEVKESLQNGKLIALLPKGFLKLALKTVNEKLIIYKKQGVSLYNSKNSKDVFQLPKKYCYVSESIIRKTLSEWNTGEANPFILDTILELLENRIFETPLERRVRITEKLENLLTKIKDEKITNI